MSWWLCSIQIYSSNIVTKVEHRSNPELTKETTYFALWISYEVRKFWKNSPRFEPHCFNWEHRWPPSVSVNFIGQHQSGLMVNDQWDHGMHVHPLIWLCNKRLTSCCGNTLTFYIVLRKFEDVFALFVIYWHWDGANSWNFSSTKHKPLNLRSSKSWLLMTWWSKEPEHQQSRWGFTTLGELPKWVSIRL